MKNHYNAVDRIFYDAIKGDSMKAPVIARLRCLFLSTKGLFFVLSVVILFVSGCVSFTKRVDRLEKRAETAEAENRRLQSRMEGYTKDLTQSDQKTAKIQNKSAGTRADLAETTEKIRYLTGRIDEFEHVLSNRMEEIKTSAGRMGKRLADLEGSGMASEKMTRRLSVLSEEIRLNHDRLDRLKKVVNLELRRIKSPPKTQFVPRPEPRRAIPMSPKDSYALAKKAFDGNDFKTARLEFQKFLKKNPGSFLAGNSQFWLGEIYYKEKKYEKAIVEYQNVLEKYPDSAKAPGALLKQGFAFLAMGDKTNAVLFFSELIRRFPGSSQTRIAEKKLERM